MGFEIWDFIDSLSVYLLSNADFKMVSAWNNAVFLLALSLTYAAQVAIHIQQLLSCGPFFPILAAESLEHEISGKEMEKHDWK